MNGLRAGLRRGSQESNKKNQLPHAFTDRKGMPPAATTQGLAFGPAKVNFSGSSDGGDEGRFGSGAKGAHFAEGEFEGCGQVLTRHVAGGKDELADGMNFQSALFEQVIADALVAGQQDPAVGTHQGKPNPIESAGREVG